MAAANSEAKVGKLDVSLNMELAVKYGVSAVPTILVFKGGEVVERTRGYQEQDALQKLIDAHTTS